MGEPLKRSVRCFVIKCKMKLAVAIVTFLLGAVVFRSCASSTEPPTRRISQVVSNNEATPARELVRTRRLGQFIVRDVSKEPVALLSAESLKGYEELILEFENVSTQPINLVEYGISRHEECAEYMYAATSSPRMVYGAEKAEVPLTPGMVGKLQVMRSKNLTDLLNPKTYESCDPNNRSPILMLMEVRFEDGSVWRPYARAF